MQKDIKLNITKEKLLGVTSRQIAERAGTKPSMINYCFGSRENLIYRTFQKQYLGFLDGSEIADLIASDISPKELLKKLHFIVAKCLVDNPKFTKAITGYILFNRDLSQESFSFVYVKKHYAGRRTDEECRLIAYEMSSMMQLLIYRKNDIKNDFGIDLDNEDELRRCIDMRIDLLLGE